MNKLEAFLGKLTAAETEELLHLVLAELPGDAALRIVIEWIKDNEHAEETVAALDDAVSEGPY